MKEGWRLCTMIYVCLKTLRLRTHTATLDTQRTKRRRRKLHLNPHSLLLPAYLLNRDNCNRLEPTGRWPRCYDPRISRTAGLRLPRQNAPRCPPPHTEDCTASPQAPTWKPGPSPELCPGGGAAGRTHVTWAGPPDAGRCRGCSAAPGPPSGAPARLSEGPLCPATGLSLKVLSTPRLCGWPPDLHFQLPNENTKPPSGSGRLNWCSLLRSKHPRPLSKLDVPATGPQSVALHPPGPARPSPGPATRDGWAGGGGRHGEASQPPRGLCHTAALASRHESVRHFRRARRKRTPAAARSVGDPAYTCYKLHRHPPAMPGPSHT